MVLMNKAIFPWAYCCFAKHPEDINAWVNVKGLEILIPFINKKKGILIVANHHGPGHMVDFILAAEGKSIHVVQSSRLVHNRHMKYAAPYISERINKIFTKEDNSPGMMKTMTTIRDLLRKGEIVIAALDGRQGSATLMLQIMGHGHEFRYAMPLVAALSHAVIIPVHSVLNTDGHIDINFDLPFPEQLPGQTPQEYAKKIITLYADKVETHMINEPGSIKMERLSFLRNCFR
jgi:lauroyl/myristoyl acyltransferase